jgi:hypothetical protein
MRNSSYQKSFDKVHSRLLSILERKEFLILDDDIAKGIITAKRKKTFFNPSIEIEIIMRRIDENNTQVHISAQAQQHWFNEREERLRDIEERILQIIS